MKNMPLKILYIHGYGSTGNSQTVQGLKKILGDEVDILAPQFSNDLSTVAQIEQNIAVAKAYASEFKPRIVIGSSFGGFIATFLTGYLRILINPCLRPSERLSSLAPTMSYEERIKLHFLETSQDIDWIEKIVVHGLFGLNDELFSYLSLFKQLYNEKKAYTMPCGHRIDLENIEKHLVPLIRDIMQTFDDDSPIIYHDEEFLSWFSRDANNKGIQ